MLQGKALLVSLVAAVLLLLALIGLQQDSLLDKRERLLALTRELEASAQVDEELAALGREAAELETLRSSRPDLETLRVEREARRERLALRTLLLGKMSQRPASASPEAEMPFSPKALSVPPKIRSQVPPRYPIGLRIEEGQGEVMLKFIVGTDGQVLDVIELPPKQGKPLPDPDFVEASIRAVQQWTFSPGIKDGKPVKTILAVPVIFTLQDPPKPKRGTPRQ